MKQQLLHFIVKHWYLVVPFILILGWLFIEEARSKGGGGVRLTPAMVTRLINSENASVFDIRTASAYAAGHIINAVNIPLTDFVAHNKQIEKYKQQPIIIVCATGQKSQTGMNKLRQLGFAKVYILAGGIQAWKNANMPLVKD